MCGYCGKPISAEYSTTKKGIKVNYYKCVGRKKYKNNCEKTTIRQDTLERFVLNEIILELQKPQIMKNLINKLLHLQDNLVDNNSILKMLLKEQKQTETTLNNIMSAIEQGVINMTTNKRMKELEEELDLLERKILIEKSKCSIKISKEDLEQYYLEIFGKEP